MALRVLKALNTNLAEYSAWVKSLKGGIENEKEEV